MKAMLVIDLPDGTNVDDIKVLYKLFDISSFRDLYYSEEEHWNTCPLKPMPQKKDLSFNELHFEEGHIKEGCTRGWKDFVKEKLTEYDMGYNTCIDEILGDTEWK